MRVLVASVPKSSCALIFLAGLALHPSWLLATEPGEKKKQNNASSAASQLPHAPNVYAGYFRSYGRKLGKSAYLKGLQKDLSPPEKNPVFEHLEHFESIADHSIDSAIASFHQGRYSRSTARLPENVEAWHFEPDIDNPGADLANWPNSAFTLPQGRSYLEVAPFGYYSSSRGRPQQFDMEYLIRYGATDDVELRVFGNGSTFTGGQVNHWNYAPMGFDTKFQIMTEHPDSILPAMGFEAYILTQWLGSSITNGGTQPGFSFNFDQSLPFEIDFEYNIGAYRSQNQFGKNEWDYNFQWALQKSFFIPSFSLFIHGYINGATIPRSPVSQSKIVTTNGVTSVNDNIVGGGFIWSLTKRLSVWGQASTGTSSGSASLLTYSGFAIAF